MLYWVAVEGCRRVFAPYMDDGEEVEAAAAAGAGAGADVKGGKP